MKFLFTYHKDKTLNGTIVNIKTDTDGVGIIGLRDGEWDALRSILIHGRTWFQRGEVEIMFNEQTSTPAFIEGGKHEGTK